MSEPVNPIQKRGEPVEVIEVEAVPLEQRRPQVKPRRPSMNLLWLIPIAIVVILMMKVLAIIAIGAMLLFALPKLIPGGWSGLIRSLLPKGPRK